MPRRARMYVGDVAYHVIQRGNNRQACFGDDHDRGLYLDLLEDSCARYGVGVHAYVLMSNHVHLLVTPRDSDGISRAMRVLGSRYAQCINRKYERTGTLWEGRHKAGAVDAESYLLACYRYIELNPVRAGLVARPQDWRWSSHQSNAWGVTADWLVPHAVYLGLAEEGERRLSVYRSLFADALGPERIGAIRAAVHYCQPVGSTAFATTLAKLAGQRPGQLARGRPRKDQRHLRFDN